ncbi:MAG: hypothetical protein M3433_03090 [Actinomycetota bacterium]|nr:hypothetical protein [Actinomycetota bacterium]
MAVGCLLVATGPPSATAGSPAYVATDQGPKRHPQNFSFHQPGVSYRFTSLRWKGWGRRRPEAHGRLTVCPNMAGCEKLGRAKLRLRRPRAARCDGVRGRYYVRGTIILDGRKTPLVLAPSYVCG